MTPGQLAEEDLAPIDTLRKPERKKRITLFRVTLLLAAAVLSATLWWAWQESRLASAERILAAAEKHGYEALRDGDFVDAETEFRRAAQALDVLGRDGPRARAIRHMHRETAAANKLIGKPLFEIIEDVQKMPDGDADRRRDYFRSHYAGDWIIMDTLVERVVDADGTARLTIDYPLMAGGRPVVLQTEAGAFGPLSVGGEPRRLIFAAQLQACRLAGAENQRWVVSLRPETAFLWVDADNYRALGFANSSAAAERSTRELLDKQARLQGVSG